MFRHLRLVFVAAVLLACAGAGALVLAPSVASAGVTPGVKPDFVVNPGDTVPQTFNQPLIGSAEVKSKPDDCRNNAALGLTCAAHRLKVNRTADKSYQLRIILEWDAQGDPSAAQVPDVDMFLFDSPDSSFDSTEVGGAGATMPEQIKVTPTQDEYDIVVQAYAGAITGYKITVSYVANATIKAGEVTPDIVLSPHAAPFSKEYTSVIVGQPGVSVYPDACRNQPGYEELCDVYRIKLNRNPAKDALNFVVVTLDWTPNATAPDLMTPAVGLVSHPVPDLDMYVYDAPDHSLDGVGGTSIENVPERVGWVATQDEYDLVIQSLDGPSTKYKLTAFMTDEVFGKPFEVLDPATGQPIVQDSSGEITPVSAPVDNSNTAVPQLALAPIDTDHDIAGIGLGTTEQFDATNPLLSGHALRQTAATGPAPSGLVLLLALLVLPGAALGAAVVLVRRRHAAIF